VMIFIRLPEISKQAQARAQADERAHEVLGLWGHR